MTSNNLGADPKPKTRSADTLCGEEGVEDLFLCGFADANTSVSYRYDQASLSGLPVGSFAATKEKAAAHRHGVDRVCDQIA